MQKSGLVAKGVDIDGLGEQIAELAAHIDAAMHGLLTPFAHLMQRLVGPNKARCRVRIGWHGALAGT